MYYMPALKVPDDLACGVQLPPSELGLWGLSAPLYKRLSCLILSVTQECVGSVSLRINRHLQVPNTSGRILDLIIHTIAPRFQTTVCTVTLVSSAVRNYLSVRSVDHC